MAIRVAVLSSAAACFGMCDTSGQFNGAVQAGAGSGPVASRPGPPSASGSAASAVDVTGRVVDGRSRQPIARALVRLGTRGVLTDHDGVFDFPGVTSGSVSLTVSKPGYYPSLDGDYATPRSILLPVTTQVELPLYPEAIISGMVVDALGESVPHLNVVARRSVFDENGHRWAPNGGTQTNSDGSFRMGVPPGVYSIQITQRGRVTAGAEAVLPVSIPPVASSVAEAIHVGVGEEAHLDVRPETKRAYRVDLTIEPEMRGYPSLSARTTNGVTMPVSALPSRGEGRGTMHVVLPSGSYTLIGSMQNQDGLAEAKTQVTVTDHDVSGVPLRFSPAPSLPVTLEMDSSAAVDSTTKIPDPNQLGLFLQSAGEMADGNSQMYRVAGGRNGRPGFSVPDGVYRLRAQGSGQWSITSASCGGVDLLREDLPVSSDLNGTEVRVRVSNQTATVSGTVTLNGVPGVAWVYLIATTPSATPVSVARSNSDGSFSRRYLPAGSYRVVAMEHRTGANMQSAATLEKLLSRLQSFSVASGEQRTLNLLAVPEQEIPQ